MLHHSLFRFSQYNTGRERGGGSSSYSRGRGRFRPTVKPRAPAGGAASSSAPQVAAGPSDDGTTGGFQAKGAAATAAAAGTEGVLKPGGGSDVGDGVEAGKVR